MPLGVGMVESVNASTEVARNALSLCFSRFTQKRFLGGGWEWDGWLRQFLAMSLDPSHFGFGPAVHEKSALGFLLRVGSRRFRFGGSSSETVRFLGVSDGPKPPKGRLWALRFRRCMI